MNETHPFLKWWIDESGWHRAGKYWEASLGRAEGQLAIAAWNAAVLAARKMTPDGPYSPIVELEFVP